MNPSDLQLDATARLNADEYFIDITVLCEQQKDIQSELDKALGCLAAKNGKVGAFCFVGGFKLGVGKPNVNGPRFDRSMLAVTVVENPLANKSATGTGKSAIDIGANVCRVLHHYRPAGLAETLTCGSNSVFPAAAPDKASLAYVCPFEFAVHMDPREKCATPTIAAETVDGHRVVTIASATADAVIWFTLNGSYPWGGNSNAILYVDPLTVDTPCVIRAVAHKAGSYASDSAFADLN